MTDTCEVQHRDAKAINPWVEKTGYVSEHTIRLFENLTANGGLQGCFNNESNIADILSADFKAKPATSPQNVQTYEA